MSNLAVRPAHGKGRGVFALVDFEEGAVVAANPMSKFTGELGEEINTGAMKRYKFDCRNGSEAKFVVWGYMTLVNHSDKPNVSVLMAETENGAFAYLVATRAIKAGEEIMHSYTNVEEHGLPTAL